MRDQEIQEMVEIIAHGGDFARGSEPAQEIADQWEAAGLSPEEAYAYLEAKCYDPEAAAALRDAGVSAAAAAAHHRYDTIGYEVANRDLSVAEVRRLLEEEEA